MEVSMHHIHHDDHDENLSYGMSGQYGEARAAKREEKGGAAKVDALVVAAECYLWMWITHVVISNKVAINYNINRLDLMFMVSVS